MYNDQTILNGIRNYVANSMKSDMFTASQLSQIGNQLYDPGQIDMNNIKYITCGYSKCGSDDEPLLQFVK